MCPVTGLISDDCVYGVHTEMGNDLDCQAGALIHRNKGRAGELRQGAGQWVARGRGGIRGLPGVRRMLDRIVGPPMVRKMTAPRLATSCHFPKVRALIPNMLPATCTTHLRYASVRTESAVAG